MDVSIFNGNPSPLSSLESTDVLTGPPGNFQVDMTCGSNLWQRATVKGTLNPLDFQGRRDRFREFSTSRIDGFPFSQCPIQRHGFTVRPQSQFRDNV
jgi:hypothetical protein